MGGPLAKMPVQLKVLVLLLPTIFLALLLVGEAGMAAAMGEPEGADEPLWMWYPEPLAGSGERYFRKTFEVRDEWKKALLVVVSNNRCEVYLNGEKLGTLKSSSLVRLWEVSRRLQPGKNVLAIAASSKRELAGVLVRVMDDKSGYHFVSDWTWKAAPKEIPGWTQVDFDDSRWARVLFSVDKVKPQLTPAEYIKLQAGFAPEFSPEDVANIECWVADDMNLVFRDSPRPWFSRKEIKLLAGRNEKEAAQLVLRSERAVPAIGIEFTPLVHENGQAVISPDHLEYAFVEYFYVPKNSTQTPLSELAFRAPKHVPDALSETAVGSLRPGVNQPVYVAVNVPKNAAPGVYRGEIRVLAGAGGKTLPLEIEVLPVDFPDRVSLWNTMWINTVNFEKYHGVELCSEEFWPVLEEYARMMAGHHGNVVWVPTELIDMTRRKDGSLEFDFRDFDRWVETFDRYGVAGRLELSHLAGRRGNWTSDFQYRTRFARTPGGGTSPVTLEEFVRGIQDHLAAKGWLERALIHIADEPIKANYRSYLRLARKVHRAAPRLKRFDAVHWVDLDGQVEVMVPQLDYFWQNYDALQRALKAGQVEELWFYTCWLPQGEYPNRLLDYGPVKTRLVHWANYLYGATGFLHFGFNWWRGMDPDVWYAPGDPWIVYPTPSGLKSSLRYEAMREGIEDYEYFLMHRRLSEKLAEKTGESDKQNPDSRSRQLLQRVMRSVTDYATDVGLINKVRENLLREIAELQKQLR